MRTWNLKKPQYSELGLRPTTSKVIGAIFSMMGHSNLEGKNFLDLYAGTGSVGIRALELGAKHCFFFDRNQDFIQKIKLKTKKLKFEEKTTALKGNCETQLNKINETFDFIFVDPPYDQKPFEKIFEQLIDYSLVHKETRLFAEHSSRIKLADEYKLFKKKQEKKYGDTSISVFSFWESNMIKGIYPGTFDPVTNGHFDIVERASKMFEEVTICVYSGSMKNVIFNVDERVEMINKSISKLSNVNVTKFDKLTVNLAEELGASVIIRGLRIGADFEYEREMALTNREMNSKIDTVCLISSLKFQYVSSSRVKEIALLGGDVSSLVPGHVLTPFLERIKKSA